MPFSLFIISLASLTHSIHLFILTPFQSLLPGRCLLFPWFHSHFDTWMEGLHALSSLSLISEPCLHHASVWSRRRELAWHRLPHLAHPFFPRPSQRVFLLQKENGSSLKEKPNALKGIHPSGGGHTSPVGVSSAKASLLGWRPWPQKRHPGVSVVGEVNTLLFWALEAEDLLLSLRQAGGRSLGQAWVPCWLHPGAGEHLVEGGGQMGFNLHLELL